jgi:alkylated DNA repair dioxygenase AlkB
MMSSLDLFAGAAPTAIERLGTRACVLRGFAGANAQDLLAGLEEVVLTAPLRHMVTPGGFVMSVALINCGSFGERDYSAPIVSVSLGMDATFLFGGHTRSQPAVQVALRHGDVAVWGAEDRLRYHGVAPLKDRPHPLVGNQPINLTFRKAV